MSTFKVEGMSCGHCVAAVSKAVKAAAPAATVDVDLTRGEVRVEPNLDRAAIAAAIRQAGYAVVEKG